MSFTQREIIDQILNWQAQKDGEVRELKRMSESFAENDRTKRAKEIAFSEKLDGLRSQFSSFFWSQPKEAKI
jgi:hypothetical protein